MEQIEQSLNDKVYFKEGRVDPKSDGYVAGYKGKKEADSKMKKS